MFHHTSDSSTIAGARRADLKLTMPTELRTNFRFRPAPNCRSAPGRRLPVTSWSRCLIPFLQMSLLHRLRMDECGVARSPVPRSFKRSNAVPTNFSTYQGARPTGPKPWLGASLNVACGNKVQRAHDLTTARLRKRGKGTLLMTWENRSKCGGDTEPNKTIRQWTDRRYRRTR